MNQRNHFNALQSYYTAGTRLPDELRLQYWDALMQYGFTQTLPDEIDPLVMAIMDGMIPSIDISFKRAASGKQGGGKTKATSKQTGSKPEANEKQTKSKGEGEKGERKKEKGYIGSNDLVPYQDILELFQSTCTSLSQPRGLPEHRKQAIRARWKEHGDMDAFQEAFANIQSSDFHSGRSGQWSGCSFDWILKPANFTKALELTPQQPEEDNPYQQLQVDYAEPVGWKEYILEELQGSRVQGEVQRGEIQEWDDLTKGQKELLTDALEAVEL